MGNLALTRSMNDFMAMRVDVVHTPLMSPS
jgi:hypothetical protein